jgi:hypothetical protein
MYIEIYLGEVVGKSPLGRHKKWKETLRRIIRRLSVFMEEDVTYS